MASADELIRRGRIETMKLWLGRCTDEEVSGDPQLIVAAWIIFIGDLYWPTHSRPLRRKETST